MEARNPNEMAWLGLWRAMDDTERAAMLSQLKRGPDMILLTPEQAELIWKALRNSKPANYPEARVRQVEALHILSTELRRLPPLPPLGESDDDDPG